MMGGKHHKKNGRKRNDVKKGEKVTPKNVHLSKSTLCKRIRGGTSAQLNCNLHTDNWELEKGRGGGETSGREKTGVGNQKRRLNTRHKGGKNNTQDYVRKEESNGVRSRSATERRKVNSKRKKDIKYKHLGEGEKKHPTWVWSARFTEQVEKIVKKKNALNWQTGTGLRMGRGGDYRRRTPAYSMADGEPQITRYMSKWGTSTKSKGGLPTQ